MQRAAEGLYDPALDLIPQRLGVDDEAAVVSANDPPHRDPAALRVDSHLYERRDVVLRLLVARVSHTATQQRALHRARVVR